ncbi:MAG TPA: hypothetical protein VK966_12065 [Longimicrobiales bacterium]|nr:hypothetical protein [Longimicrobiales bacterium]
MGPVLRGGWSALALPAALVGMILTGAGVTAAFYASGSEAPVPSDRLAAQASVVAEYGLRSAMADSGIAGGAPALPLGRPVTVYQSDSGSARATYVVDVLELSDSMSVLKSEGRVVLDGIIAVREVKTVVPRPSTPTE